MAKDIKIATAVAAAANGIEAADSIFYEYGDILGVAGLQEYQSFAGYEGAYKTVFCQMFNGQTTEKILKAETFADLFGSAVVLTDLSSANGTGAVAEVLEKYNGYFDLKKYTESDYQNEICSAISKGFENGKIKTIEDVQKLLDADYTKQTSGGGNSGGTKNNGGSSGVSAGILPSVNQQPVSSEETAANQADFQFYDLENVEWARDAIEYLAKTSVLSGKEKGVFAPSENLTRAQACTILCRMFSIPEWDAGSTFTDIAEGDWCKGYVMAANQMGIVMGQSEKFFGADSDITRQDFVVMLKRAMDYFQVALEKNDTEVTFIDAENIREYALESVKAFSAAGIISGRDDGSFDPTGRITRAEAARVAYNVKMIYEGRK